MVGGLRRSGSHGYPSRESGQRCAQTSLLLQRLRSDMSDLKRVEKNTYGILVKPTWLNGDFTMVPLWSV